MRVGDLFAGIGGASCAVHAVYPDAETVWQSDLVNEAVRARHFPNAAQLVGDVRALDPATLPRVDLLTAGFPCQDLSVAGKGGGLDGARSGLYSEVLRFTAAQRPERVLIENVPALLHYLPRLSADFRALGYGLTWTVCEAADAGHPHLRRRVFVLAELDRREPWPGFDWEPPRTLPDGPPLRGRRPRLAALGNAWCPAQGALALRALLAPTQADLFGGAL